MDIKFLKTDQKNEKILHTNFDLSHKNQNTYNLGELKVSQLEPILPSDSAELRVNDEVICQPLENPAFSHYKLCHKTFYMPNCNLWKYWDRFITEKPDFTWTSSNIQTFIESEQPYTPPYFTWNDILPIVAFARGFIADPYIGWYPIQDSNSDPSIVYNVSGNKLQITDLCNMGKCPVTSDDYSMINVPRVCFDPNRVNAFDTQNSIVDLDTTFPRTDVLSNSCAMEYHFNDWLGDASSGTRFYNWSNGNNISLTDKDKFRFGVLFNVTRRQNYTYQVYKNNINGQVFSGIQLTNHQNIGTNEFFQGYYDGVYPSRPGSDPNNNVVTYFFLPLPAGYECSQYRMSMIMYLWYLCKNATKLLDSMGIPVYTETLQPMNEKFDALPFFAYNRIYHEYFANKQLQVNSPDWSEANGPLCPRFDNTDMPSNHYTFGWILHHPELPYNVGSFTYDEKIIIRNTFQGRCLLLGININSLMFSDNLDLSNFNYQMSRSNKALSHTYMIYNGLLHLQYVNFPPDYFTEALLDPLAGAKDINIPTTITQLQEKSKLQDFLNQTAWTRNIKEWLQSQWDSFSKFTTVNEPSLCGSSDVDINISQVLQTSESANTPLGTRAGVGSGYGNGYLCKQQFGEYGILLTLSYIVLDTMYINRLDVRQRHKTSRFDYPLPQFANLGNESILPSELNFEVSYQQTFGSSVYLSYVSDTAQVPGFKTFSSPRDIMDSYGQVNGQFEPNNATPQKVDQPLGLNRIFGYIPRYSIYKHHMDEVHGDFLTTLKRWVPTRELNKFPTFLNYVFISYELASETCNLLKNFVNNTQFGDDNFLVNHTNILHMRRALPYIVKPLL